MELNMIDMNLSLHDSVGTGKNVICFDVDMSSSTKTDNRNKN